MRSSAKVVVVKKRLGVQLEETKGSPKGRIAESAPSYEVSTGNDGAGYEPRKMHKAFSQPDIGLTVSPPGAR